MLVRPKIEVWFDVDVSGGDFFTLDDPVRGVLDGSYLLGDPSADQLATDITADAWAFTTNRGRDAELAEIATGTAQVSVSNYDGDFLPADLSAGSAYGAANVVPGRRARISVESVVLFDGRIDDWRFAYAPSGEVSASFAMVDAMGTLARQRFAEWTSTAGQTPGERLNDALDRSEVAWPAGQRLIDSGSSSLQSEVISWDSNVLNYCQLVARSEIGGRFFADRRGNVRFRREVPGETAKVTFADDGSGARFVKIDVTSTSERLFTRVSVDRESGVRQTVDDDDAVDAFGVRALTRTGLLFDSDAQSASMASYLLASFKDPQVRVSGLRVHLEALTPEQRGLVLALELGDTVTVKWTPTGASEQVSQDSHVEGIRHSSTHASLHAVDLQLSPLLVQLADLFMLDTSELDGADVMAY